MLTWQFLVFGLSLCLGWSAATSQGQCDDTFPDGTVCGPNDFVQQADPELCYKFYKCETGCVTHETCPDDFKYHVLYGFCMYPGDVDCGDRPCPDGNVHCPDPVTTTTPEPDCTPPEQTIDCEAVGRGYHPDPYNCRRYWNCEPGLEPTHYLCPDDEEGNPEMFDLSYDGCNYDYLTDCSGRPVCDDCNADCQDTSTTTTTPDCSPPEEYIDCAVMGSGWFPDKHNCRRYWHCATPASQPEHLICPDDKDGIPEVFDVAYEGCNYEKYTDCGDRPICDPCGDNCVTPTPGPIVDCGHDLDCSTKPSGWYPDPYSCVKYWNCNGDRATHYICPDGLMYEPTKVQCDFPDRVQCGSRPPCNECMDGCP